MKKKAFCFKKKISKIFLRENTLQIVYFLNKGFFSPTLLSHNKTAIFAYTHVILLRKGDFPQFVQNSW